jgi:hypothetical protein
MIETQDMVRLPNPVITELNRRIEDSGSKKAAATELGISQQYLGDVVAERRAAGKKLLSKLGFTRISFHIRTDRVKPVVRLITMAMEEDEHMQKLLDKVLAKK